MAISYKYLIHQLDAKINDNGKDNVIYNVHYGIIGTDDSDENINYSVNAVLHLEAPSEDFIEYDDLTKENVISWIDASGDVENLKNIISEEITKKLNPTDIHLHPNWE